MSQISPTSAQTASASAEVHAALVAIARAIADSLAVREVWDRGFEACRTIVPVDAMGIVCLEPDGNVRAVAAAGPPEVRKLEGLVFPRAAMSPRFWPDEDRFVVLANDVERDLDMTYAMDRRTIEFGCHSVIRLPLGYSGRRLRCVLLSATERGRFTMDHALKLAVVAELVTVALAHEQRASALAEETRRAAEARARAALLEERVQTLAKELEHLSPHRALGNSRKWRDALGHATKVAPTDTTVP